jgi:hypothetical protein
MSLRSRSNFRRQYMKHCPACSPALGPTQPPIKWVIKRPGRETVYSPPSSADVKNAGSYTSTPPYLFIAELTTEYVFRIRYLVKNKFTFYSYPYWRKSYVQIITPTELPIVAAILKDIHSCHSPAKVLLGITCRFTIHLDHPDIRI